PGFFELLPRVLCPPFFSNRAHLSRFASRGFLSRFAPSLRNQCTICMDVQGLPAVDVVCAADSEFRDGLLYEPWHYSLGGNMVPGGGRAVLPHAPAAHSRPKSSQPADGHLCGDLLCTCAAALPPLGMAQPHLCRPLVNAM